MDNANISTPYKISNIICSIVFFVLLVFIDQISKFWAATSLKNHNAIVILKDWFELQYLENQGAAWGVLYGKLPFLVTITLLIVLIFLFFYFKIPATRFFLPLRISFILILSGAVGNLIDRILHKYVIDFLYFKKIDFPIFNIADIYVTVGAAVFLILFLFVYKENDLSFWNIFSKKEHN